MMARPTTTDSGLLSSCATPARSEPSDASFSRWCAVSRWRRISASACLRSVMSRPTDWISISLPVEVEDAGVDPLLARAVRRRHVELVGDGRLAGVRPAQAARIRSCCSAG